jgi:hypothetical protein
LLAQLRGLLFPATRRNPEKDPRDGLYVHMLWGGGGGLGARPEVVPGIGKLEEKELCPGSPAALSHVNRPGG